MINTEYLTIIKTVITNSGIFCIGGNDGELLIDNVSEMPLLPGSTVAGAFKAYLRDFVSEEDLENLFANSLEGGKSSLFISDSYGKCDNPFKNRTTRKHAPIDGRTGTNKNLNIIEYFDGPISFDLKIIVECNSKEKSEYFKKCILKCIKAINIGEVRFGGDKTNGAGKFFCEMCQFAIVDLKERIQLKKYLMNQLEFEEVVLDELSVTSRFYEICSDFEFITPLIVRDKVNREVDTMSIKNINGEYIIPGSSQKGVIRNQCLKIAKYIGLDESFVDDMFGCAKGQGQCGRIFFEDSKVEEANSSVIYNRIHVDSFTGAVITSGKFNERPVFGKSSMKIQIKADDKDKSFDAKLGLLLLAVRDLLVGLVHIGGGYNVGYGKVRGSEIRLKTNAELINVKLDGDTKALDRYVDAFRKQKAEV